MIVVIPGQLQETLHLKRELVENAEGLIAKGDLKMKWSIVIVMVSYLAISLWSKGGLEIDLQLTVDFIIEIWENLS